MWDVNCLESLYLQGVLKCLISVLYLYKVANNKIESKGIGALVQGIKKSSAHELSLFFGWNRIGNAGIGFLSELFSIKHIEKLSVEHCSIGLEGLNELGKAIQATTNSMQLLNVSGNKLEDKVFKVLASSVNKVFKLSIETNKITFIGIQYLSHITTLMTINLYGNNIGKEGAQELSNRVKSKLRKLVLEKCNIGDEGVMHIMKVVDTCKSMQLLILSNFTS
jgi:Ran GTPase-activating protein (RanGAP) involved in mRNA processing and transport